MQDRIAELRERLEAQERWGKWNTARTANELAALEWAAKTPAQRVLAKVGEGALIAVACVVGYAPLIAVAYSVAKYFFAGH